MATLAQKIADQEQGVADLACEVRKMQIAVKAKKKELIQAVDDLMELRQDDKDGQEHLLLTVER